MAEEPDLAATVIAVPRLAGSLISTCYDYQLRSDRNGSMDLKPTIEYLRSLSDIIHTIVSDADSNGHPLSSSTSNPNKVDGPLLVQCMTELHGLERILKTGNWPSGATELTNTLENLNRIKAELGARGSAAPGDISHGALRENSTSNVDAHYARAMPGDGKVPTESYFTTNIDARYSTHNNVEGDQYNYYASLKDNVGDDQRQKIHKWLAAPDPSSNHNDACKLRQRTTGTWFVNGEEFKRWKNALNSFIWLHGIPGCGKSVLCSTIIEDVRHHCQSHLSFAIAYFYFDFSDTEKQRSDKLIRSLVTQLSAHSLSCPDTLKALYSQNLNGQQQPNTEGLMLTLKHIIGGFKHVYVVLDALDECQDREQFLTLVEEIVNWKIGKLHILATSRKERDIADCIGPLVTAQINLCSTLVDADIQTHLRERLRNDSRLKRWPAKVHEQIEAVLMEGAHGM